MKKIQEQKLRHDERIMRPPSRRIPLVGDSDLGVEEVREVLEKENEVVAEPGVERAVLSPRRAVD
jgi:hypothetical protein